MDAERIEAIEETGRYLCRRCQGRIRSLQFDGEHEDCEPRVDEAKAREARRIGEERTAKMLRRLGFPARAAIHEARAR